jgi:hypothetical protein
MDNGPSDVVAHSVRPAPVATDLAVVVHCLVVVVRTFHSAVVVPGVDSTDPAYSDDKVVRWDTLSEDRRADRVGDSTSPADVVHRVNNSWVDMLDSASDELVVWRKGQAFVVRSGMFVVAVLDRRLKIQKQTKT